MLFRSGEDAAYKAITAGLNMDMASLTYSHNLAKLVKDGKVSEKYLDEMVHLAQHDLRRTCARLCHGAGGELEQIQFLLGHASVQTTERYIGCRQKFKDAVNDRFQISLASRAR